LKKPTRNPQQERDPAVPASTVSDSNRGEAVPESPAYILLKWKKLYQEAMLEIGPEKVEDRIATALEEMDRRNRELEVNRAETLEERQDIMESIAALKHLQRIRKLM
jgi:hypothetical protein